MTCLYPEPQIREEVGFTKGRIIVRGKLVTRGKAKRADYILYYKPNIPLALIDGAGAHTILDQAGAAAGKHARVVDKDILLSYFGTAEEEGWPFDGFDDVPEGDVTRVLRQLVTALDPGDRPDDPGLTEL